MKQTMSISSAARKPVNTAARDPSRSTCAPLVPQRALTIHVVNHGFNPVSVESPHVAADGFIDSHENSYLMMPQSYSMTHVPPADCPQPSASTFPPTGSRISNPHEIAGVLARQHVIQQLQQSVSTPKVTERNPRTCMKCGDMECRGKQRRAWCEKMCQDCGQKDCVGRDSDKPEKKCYDVPLSERRVRVRKK
jgi:hypothetical protein